MIWLMNLTRFTTKAKIILSSQHLSGLNDHTLCLSLLTNVRKGTLVLLSFFSLTVIVFCSVAHIFILICGVYILFKIKIETILRWWWAVDRVEFFSGWWLQIKLVLCINFQIWNIVWLKIELPLTNLTQGGLIYDFALKWILFVFLWLGFFILVFLPFMLVLDLSLNVSNFLMGKFLVITWNTFWV